MIRRAKQGVMEAPPHYKTYDELFQKEKDINR